MDAPGPAISRGDAVRIALVYAGIAAVTIAGLFASSLVGRSYLLIGEMSVVAYVFGLRHGLDADHIAAIDNSSRKLLKDGTKPTTVGLWFSLGHSTVVTVLVVSLVLFTRDVVAAMPGLQAMGAVVGTAISGLFLWLMGVVNLAIALEVYRVFRSVRREGGEAGLDEAMGKRGFMSRIFGSVLGAVKRPWHLYPIGILFGLGFDTASEVALIAVSVGVGVSNAAPLWSVLLLPLLFTCGMTLVDTSDGLMMSLAYSWAFVKPIRKVYYNLTITLISVLVSFLVGGIEFLQVFSSELNIGAAWLAGINFESMGIGVVGIFVACWVGAIALYRLKRFEDPLLPGV